MPISTCRNSSLTQNELFPEIVIPGPLTLERLKAKFKGDYTTVRALCGMVDCHYAIAKDSDMTDEEALEHTLKKMVDYFDSKINKRRIP